jgi:ABC-type multidrug transport system ATPase subunit
MTIAISFEGLVKQYGKQRAVDNLTASVQAGRITGFLGPNGAGKSTSLRCLVGLSNPTSGSVKILGSTYQSLDNPLSKVGTVLDSRGFHPALTGRQNLKVVAAAAGIADSRVDQVLAQVELTDAKDKRMKNYSLGMKQRLALAGAILGDPEILILDEPTAALGVKEAAHVLRIIMQAKHRGIAVVLVTHNVSHALTVGDHFAVLILGEKADDFANGERTREQIIDLMAGGEAMAELEAELASLTGTIKQVRD